MADEVKEVKIFKWEYGNFLKYVQKGNVQAAIIYAKALGIDRRTLVHWMSQPELREALQEHIDDLLDGMKKAGKDDWRMHREVLKMLGVDDSINIDVKSDGEKIQPATIIDLGNINVSNKPETEQSSPGDKESQ